MMITEPESLAVKYIRVGAMLAIVACHILQAYSSQWAFVLNVGVQVFLVLSGYLYGKKQITAWKQWGLGRVKRVYVPMFLFLILAFPGYLLFHPEELSMKAYAMNFVNLQGFPFVLGGGTVRGIRHLWFITAIMFAYLSTPLLQWLARWANWVFPALLTCVAGLYCFVPGPYVFLASWVFLYAIAYLYVHLKKTVLYNWGLVVLELALIVLVIWHKDVISDFFHPLNRLFHDVSGIFIVILGILGLSHLNPGPLPKIVEVFDKYSFHIFIVHYFFIIGPFSLVGVTPYVLVNISLMIAVTVLATLFFVCLNRLADKWFFGRLLNLN